MIKYTFVEKAEASGEYTIAMKFLEGKYEGMVFSYGKVEFVEHGDEDAATLKFAYEIHKNPGNVDSFDKQEVEYVLGGFLQELIKEQLGKNELIYTNGTD